MQKQEIKIPVAELHQCIQREPLQRKLISDRLSCVDNSLDFCPKRWYDVLLKGGEPMIHQRKSNKNYTGRLFPIEGGGRLCFL